MQTIDRVVDALLATDAHKATKFVSEKHVVRATRRLFGGKILKRGSIDIVLTIGPPNYAERQFIKQLRKVGEPLPLKKIQLKFPPMKRAA